MILPAVHAHTGRFQDVVPPLAPGVSNRRAGLGTFCVLLAAGLIAALPASAQDSDGVHIGLGLGWGFPSGEVSTVTDVVTFSPPMAATDVYYRTLTFHVAAGAHTETWLAELSVDGGIARLTPEVHAAIDSVRPDGRRADVEDFSFELFAARMLRLTFAGEGLSLFAGAGLGVATLQLVSNNGYDPENDLGLGVSAKAGLHWRYRDYAALRIVGRYQVLTAGVDLPRTVSVSAMLLAWGIW